MQAKHHPLTKPSQIKGIGTESVWEQVEECVELDEVAETFQLTVPDVRWALSYENAARAA